MKYISRIKVSQDDAEKINRYLTVEPENEEDCLSENEKIAHCVHFENGFEMDIECCGGQYQEGECNTAWTQACLYDPDGRPCGFTEPCNEFFGEWEIEYNGNHYVAAVVEEETFFPNNDSKVLEIIKSLSYQEKDTLYRHLWAEHVRQDVESFCEDEGLDFPDSVVEHIAERYVYDGDYDCNRSYWDNIGELVREAIMSGEVS